ncbi:MAG: ABC transporter ATP-binding protein [Eubacteriales bacterium]|nr:ABC transporter ATP-binding protein [Eubacteriales bacterium]
MNILEVRNLQKNYPSFRLDGVSFSLEAGKITGFIGRNGAGKSTTLNSLFNFVHPDGGDISFFGLPFTGNEAKIKLRTGFVAGSVNFYLKKSLDVISDVTRSFYSNWDDSAYRRYMSLFALDSKKTPSELSAGMKVKYSLVLALSHNAELLILDEPTSGLDPVSRDDLLDVLLELCGEGKTILFSTHITSDLDKCAHNIIYISGGRIIADAPTRKFEDSYRLVAYQNDAEAAPHEKMILGKRRVRDGFSALMYTADAERTGRQCLKPDLEAIMVHLERGNTHE